MGLRTPEGKSARGGAQHKLTRLLLVLQRHLYVAITTLLGLHLVRMWLPTGTPGTNVTHWSPVAPTQCRVLLIKGGLLGHCPRAVGTADREQVSGDTVLHNSSRELFCSDEKKKLPLEKGGEIIWC